MTEPLSIINNYLSIYLSISISIYLYIYWSTTHRMLKSNRSKRQHERRSMILFCSEALSSLIKIQTKIQITQQHNKSKFKKYLRNKINNCQDQNIIVSLQKKIVRRISWANSIQRSHQRHWYSLSVFTTNCEQCSALTFV